MPSLESATLTGGKAGVPGRGFDISSSGSSSDGKSEADEIGLQEEPDVQVLPTPEAGAVSFASNGVHRRSGSQILSLVCQLSWVLCMDWTLD